MQVPYSLRKLAEALAENAADAGVPGVADRCRVVIDAYWHRTRVSARTLQWVIDTADEVGVTA